VKAQGSEAAARFALSVFVKGGANDTEKKGENFPHHPRSLLVTKKRKAKESSPALDEALFALEVAPLR
jgi:hypothetical protein